MIIGKINDLSETLVSEQVLFVIVNCLPVISDANTVFLYTNKNLFSFAGICSMDPSNVPIFRFKIKSSLGSLSQEIRMLEFPILFITSPKGILCIDERFIYE